MKVKLHFFGSNVSTRLTVLTTALTVALDGRGDVFTQTFVDVEHVQVDAPQLGDEGMTNSFAGSDVCLEDAAELAHRLCILQDVHVLHTRCTTNTSFRGMELHSDRLDEEGSVRLSYLCSLLDDAVPHLVGQQHVLLYQQLLNRQVSLSSNHVAHCLVKRVNLETIKGLETPPNTDDQTPEQHRRRCSPAVAAGHK